MIGVQQSGAKAFVERVGVRDGGASSDIAKISMLRDGVDCVLYDSAASMTLSPTVFPASANGAGAASSPTSIATNAVTVSVEGGTEPYSYGWVQVGSSEGWTISSPSSRFTAFLKSNVPVESSVSEVFRCTVTDDRGRTGTADVQANVYNYGEFFA